MIDYMPLLMQEPIIIQDCDTDSASLHSHNFFEFVYVASGKAEHTVDGHSMILSSGDYFLINLKSSHTYRRIDYGEQFVVINFLFLPEFLDRTLKNADSFQKILNNYLLRFGYRKFSDRVTQQAYHDTDGFISVLAKKMLTEYREKKPGYEEVLRNGLITLLVHLVRNDTESNGDHTDTITPYLKDYVAKHYMEDVSLSALASSLNYSLTHVSLTFKREMQCSFRDYLMRVRMEKACRLLRVTKKSVSEIAAMVGYADPSFFHKAFRKSLGLTPGEYRRQSDVG